MHMRVKEKSNILPPLTAMRLIPSCHHYIRMAKTNSLDSVPARVDDLRVVWLKARGIIRRRETQVAISGRDCLRTLPKSVPIDSASQQECILLLYSKPQKKFIFDSLARLHSPIRIACPRSVSRSEQGCIRTNSQMGRPRTQKYGTLEMYSPSSTARTHHQ